MADGTRRLEALAPWSIALLDESYRTQPERRFALLSCVVVPLNRVDGVVAALRGLGKGSWRLHWRNEGLARRREISRSLAATGIGGRTWVTVIPEQRRAGQERARRILLEAALGDLTLAGCSLVVIESRHPERDSHDRDAIRAFRATGVVGGGVGIRHGRPTEEPLLWLPDALAGAVGDVCCGLPEVDDGLTSITDMVEVPWR